MRYFGAGTGEKDPTEKVTLTFEFAPDLTTGESLSGNPTVSINLLSGVPDSNIGTMATGSAQLSGTMVLQLCQGGIVGNQYDIKATCNTSLGHILTIGAILPIVDAALQ